MSSFRTSLSSIRQRSEGSPWITLLAGLLIGLLMGLFVGWVVWPVEWQGALLSDLVPEARAEYLSAVADSYFAYSSEAAREEASKRLSGLQGNVLLEIQSAMDYYRARPSSQNEIRIHNLAQLANALGGQANPAMAQILIPATTEPVVVVPLANNEAPVVVATAAVAGINPAAASLSEASNETSWFSWLLTLFAGLLLFGGGLYLLQRLRQGGNGLFSTGSGSRVVGGTSVAADDYSFDDEQDFAEVTPVIASRTTKTPWLEENNARLVQNQAQPPRASWDEAPDEPTFDSDWDDLAHEPTGQAPETWLGNRPSTTNLPPESDSRWREDAGDHVGRNEANLEETRKNEIYGNEIYSNESDEDESDEDEIDSSSYRRPVHAVQSSPQRYRDDLNQPARYTDPIEEDDEEEDDDDDLWGEDENPPTARTIPPSARHRNLEDRTPPRLDSRPQPTRTGSAPLPRQPGSKIVGSFDCAFMAGVGDYDESFNVADPVSKSYIGECGMGVSTKNRILHKNPDEVIALEVWLFDKADGSSLSTQMRVMMSEYASDRYSDVFSKERNGDARPFVPQQGVKFQLECPTLILNGEVVEVNYTREGIFQNVKVHMDVLRR